MNYNEDKWRVSSDGIGVEITMSDPDWIYGSERIAEISNGLRQVHDSEEIARRIVACVKACKSIPTEELEGGVIREALDKLNENHYSFSDNENDVEIGNILRRLGYKD